MKSARKTNKYERSFKFQHCFSFNLISVHFFSTLILRRPKEDKTKTMLYIKGTKETSLLLSFLSNTSMIVPSTGRLTGIPPTLLAPVAFNGASLHSLKLKLSQITHNGEPLHNLDLIGPVLPTVVNNMSSFFCNTLDSFRSKLVTYDSSAPFATFHSCPLPKSENLISLFATENLKECGLTKQLVGDLCRYTNQSKTILNEIVADSNGYMVK